MGYIYMCPYVCTGVYICMYKYRYIYRFVCLCIFDFDLQTCDFISNIPEENTKIN